ncbi:MAG: Stp1/IreP family PP2C-type Ser/Thr phosphatase [Oscillospiraceae bacterium]|nr:Stp1/IreP family PP2C-type Ser/Thr phosphatase [Oscillospiraceae bacterium]
MQYWAVTDPGCVRAQNQDAYQIAVLDRNTLLCAVCDGMGGAKSGNVASSLAVDVFIQEVKRTWKPDMDQDALDQMLRGAVKLANFTVFDQANQFEEFTGMGTTLVAVLIRHKEATIVNVGDSRAYLIHNHSVRQLTTDHSLVQMMLSRGELTQEQARKYPGKNLITRAIGTETIVECDIFHKGLSSGDCLLLCTDGLSNMLDEQELLFEVVHAANKRNTCKQLLEIAKSRGAPDNVTCAIIQI